jgi:hypothetical protein
MLTFKLEKKNLNKLKNKILLNIQSDCFFWKLWGAPLLFKNANDSNEFSKREIENFNLLKITMSRENIEIKFKLDELKHRLALKF